LHSPQYVQCAQLLSKPKQASIICLSLAEKIKSSFPNIDLILSPAMGGIIIGYEIGKLLGVETIFSERVNGEFSLRRDFAINEGSNVLIVEDVITTGKSSLECSKLVTKAKANIIGYSCLIDRSNNQSSIKGKIVSQVEIAIPTYEEKNLPKDLLSIKPIKPGSRGL
jgi:orotate phosphoribosyltransferase